MTDQPTRDQLIEQAAQVLEDTYLGGSESSWTLMARALADAGLLAEPEQRFYRELLPQLAAEPIGEVDRG